MFEDATFDSRGIAPSQTPRWMLLAFAANGMLVTAMVVIPLFYPQALPGLLLHQVLYTPPVERVVIPEKAISRSGDRSVMDAELPSQPLVGATRKTPSVSGEVEAGPPSDFSALNEMQEGAEGGAGPQTGIFRGESGKVAGPAGRTRDSVRVSQGVSEGLLIERVNPSYPEIARTMRISGTVTLAAKISAEGRIEDLRVVSGHPLLREAALSAVKNWKYRPYRLNGAPVEVETTITIQFTMGS